MRQGFYAQLQFLTTEAGGRRTPVRSGYHPTALFPSDPAMYHDLWLDFQGPEWLQPGESRRARVRPSHPELFLEHVQPGEHFQVTEGARVVALGEVLEFF